jgi:hypothetical protein
MWTTRNYFWQSCNLAVYMDKNLNQSAGVKLIHLYYFPAGVLIAVGIIYDRKMREWEEKKPLMILQ